MLRPKVGSFKPGDEPVENVTVQRDKHMQSLFPGGDEIGIFQNPVVMGHGGFADIELPVKVSTAQFLLLDEQANNPVACGVSQSLEDFHCLFLERIHSN